MSTFKTFPAHVKAIAPDDTSGTFEAIVSVFGVVDSYGDVVMPGAFAEDLERWKSSGNPIPVVWSHQWSDPDSHIGEVLEAAELMPGDARLPAELKEFGGLWVKGRNDLGEPKAAKVHRLMKGRRIRQFSFAYDVLDGAPAERDGKAVYELRKLAVLEVGPTLIGVNRSTELLAAKGANPHGLATLVAAKALLEELIAGAAGVELTTPVATEATIPTPPAPAEAPAKSADPRLSPLGTLITLTELMEVSE